MSKPKVMPAGTVMSSCQAAEPPARAVLGVPERRVGGAMVTAPWDGVAEWTVSVMVMSLVTVVMASVPTYYHNHFQDCHFPIL